jgi:hypothetical protein
MPPVWLRSLERLIADALAMLLVAFRLPLIVAMQLLSWVAL